MNTDCTSTGYREPTPFYVCFIPLPPPYPSSIKRASTHATVAPPPISDHPLAFRDCFNHPRGLPPPSPPCGQSACCVMISSHVGLRFDRDPVGGGTWWTRNRNFGGIDRERRYWPWNFVYCTYDANVNTEVNFELRHTR